MNEIEGVRLEADDVVLRPFSGLKLSNARAWIRVESGELAVSVRSPNMIYLGIEPFLDPIRGQARFESLKEQVSL